MNFKIALEPFNHYNNFLVLNSFLSIHRSKTYWQATPFHPSSFASLFRTTIQEIIFIGHDFKGGGEIKPENNVSYDSIKMNSSS